MDEESYFSSSDSFELDDHSLNNTTCDNVDSDELNIVDSVSAVLPDSSLPPPIHLPLKTDDDDEEDTKIFVVNNIASSTSKKGPIKQMKISISSVEKNHPK